MKAYLLTFKHSLIHQYNNEYSEQHEHAHIHTYIYTYIHTYIHTYIQPFLLTVMNSYQKLKLTIIYITRCHHASINTCTQTYLYNNTNQQERSSNYHWKDKSLVGC